MILLSLLFTLFIASPDEGVGIDPNGRPVLTAAGDDGRGIDPNGGVRAQGDYGCGIDPNG